MSTEKAKRHYFLAATQVVFRTQDGEPGISEHNCVLDWPTRTVSVMGIGKIQQLAQLIFRKNVAPDPSIEVKDVFILGISYLGLQTEEEFHDVGDLKGSSETSGKSLLDRSKTTELLSPKNGANSNVSSTHKRGRT